MNRSRWIFAHFSCNGPSGVSPRISRFQHAKKTCLRLSSAGRSFVVFLVLCCTDAQKSYQKKYALVLRFRVRYAGCRTAQEYRQRAPIGGSRSAGNVRVERAEPAGDNWLMANALHRKPLSRAKKAAPPCGDAAV